MFGNGWSTERSLRGGQLRRRAVRSGVVYISLEFFCYVNVPFFGVIGTYGTERPLQDLERFGSRSLPE